MYFDSATKEEYADQHAGKHPEVELNDGTNSDMSRFVVPLVLILPPQFFLLATRLY